MFGWIHIAVVIAATGIFLLLFYFLHHLFHHPKPPQPVAGHTSVDPSSKPTLFNWSDNPTLVTNAFENGWSQFGFSEYVSSSSVRSKRFSLGSCAGVDAIGGDEDEVEISWEVCHGSADFMQKIRLKSGVKRITKTSVIKSALPLPGPALAGSSPFPQEAYFEITILSNHENENENENGSGGNGKGRLSTGEDENIMLIDQDVNGNFEELRGRSCAKERNEGGNEVSVMMSVGLTGGGSLPVKLPGSYAGSVGFHSDGSIYLDGTKLVSEPNIERWGKIDKVIGCGYLPSRKKVFFTLDSKLVHEINCKGDEFGTPLYPTFAANGDVSDVTVLVNFGQSIFKYAPANLQRTRNPCFIGPMATSSSSGYEDSKELFSMGKLDSQWLHQTTRSGAYHGTINKGKMEDYDEASEGDLFEIVIEGNSYRKSPSTLS